MKLYGSLIMLLSMHGSTMKLSNAQQAEIINNYQNTRLKLLKTNAAIWFNTMCKIKRTDNAFKAYWLRDTDIIVKLQLG